MSNDQTFVNSKFLYLRGMTEPDWIQVIFFFFLQIDSDHGLYGIGHSTLILQHPKI